MRYLFPTAAFIAAVAALPAAAQTSDADFVHKASVANIFEIESSQLALQRTQNPAVRAFAQKMIDDHTKASADLQAATTAATIGVQPDVALDAAHKADIDALTSASPVGFDHLYVELQTHAHEDAVNLFTDYASSGNAPALQALAHDTLPTLQDHLAQIETLAQSTPGG